MLPQLYPAFLSADISQLFRLLSFFAAHQTRFTAFYSIFFITCKSYTYVFALFCVILRLLQFKAPPPLSPNHTTQPFFERNNKIIEQNHPSPIQQANPYIYNITRVYYARDLEICCLIEAVYRFIFSKKQIFLKKISASRRINFCLARVTGLPPKFNFVA